MIEVTDLKKVYWQANREIRALDGVTLTVPDNHVHGVIGQSGAGKSTLVRCIALLDRPSSGRVQIGGTDLTAVRADELRRSRRRLGLVFQQDNLFDSRTILANVAYPLELIGVGRDQRTAKARELLGLVGLGDAEGAYPAQLSGGQRQRVGIARALASDPDVLLCDEPTSALDPATTGEILDLIGNLKDRLGLAVLVITHEMGVVKRICDSVSLLEDGRIIESGTLVDTVGRFGSRLSEALLRLPPGADIDPHQGSTIEILEAVTTAGISALTTVIRQRGVDLPVVAGTVEELGGTTFRRFRVLVPLPLKPDEVVDDLRLLGAQAGLSSPTTEGEAA